jgi:NADH-quinone oxidoreductase subunit M
MATTRGFISDPAILVSVSHGFVAGCLFFCIGHFYERRASRSILILREGWASSVLLMLVWVVICFMNAGFPITARLFGELAMFQAVAVEMLAIVLVLVVRGVIGGVFSFRLFDWTSFQKDSKQGGLSIEIWLLFVCLCLSIWNLLIVFWA